MRRKIIIIGVACLMVVLASMTVNAQEQQRKVTPVKPKTNKVLTPPKGTDEKIIQQYLTGDTAQARAQERKDSLAKIYPHYPKLTEFSLGLGFGDALMMAFGQKYASFDFSATLNMWNRFQPVLVLGLGRAKNMPDDMNFTYVGKLSPFFKIGANYNFLYKNEPQYQLYAGVRLGYSTFKYDVDDVSVSNPYWAGLKVGLFSNFSLGWEVKFHGIFKEKKSDSGKPWFIPGYGTRNGNWAFGISLYYTIPLSRDRWPVKEDKKKGNKKTTNNPPVVPPVK